MNEHKHTPKTRKPASPKPQPEPASPKPEARNDEFATPYSTQGQWRNEHGGTWRQHPIAARAAAKAREVLADELHVYPLLDAEATDRHTLTHVANTREIFRQLADLLAPHDLVALCNLGESFYFNPMSPDFIAKLRQRDEQAAAMLSKRASN